MRYKIRRIVHRTKHPYYSGKYSQKTEYKFYIDGVEAYCTRDGRPYNDIRTFKKAMAQKFDIPVEEIGHQQK